MTGFFKKLYRYYHKMSDMSILLLAAGLEISLTLYILSFFICNISFLGEIPQSVSGEISSSASAIMIFSFLFAPVTDAVIKCDLKE